MVWIKFLLCLAVIWQAGTRLSRYGDIIAEKTGLGRNWVGLVLLATVTSLPELATGLTAVTVAEVPNIAVGNLLGACVLNLAMLAVVDMAYRQEPVYTRASQGHILSASFGVLMGGIAGLSILLYGGDHIPAIGRIGIYAPILIVAYMLAIRTVYQYERRQLAEFVEESAEDYPDVTLRQAVSRYLIAAAAVVAAGIWLPFVGVDIAREMGWHNSFVGTLFIALATTSPELAVTISAVRIGALDMAIANLLGSNLFNLLIIGLLDPFFARGPLLGAVSLLHASSAFSMTIMSGAAIAALLYRPVDRLIRSIGWISLFLIALYAVNSYVLFRFGE